MNRSGLAAGVGSAAFALVVAVALSAGCSGGNSSTGDGGASCGANASLCSGSCANLQTDNANCGTCGTACGAGEVCSQGKCGTSCGGGTKLCGSTCADTKNDPQNCGDCNTKCPSGQVCSNSACGTSCSSGQTFCSGNTPYCANTNTDNANCGACGTTCSAGQVCAGGSCTNSCASPDGGVETLCTPDAGAPYCTDTNYDPSNCGACGTVCGQTGVCTGGTCVERNVVSGDYAAFVTATQAVGQANVLYPGDTITEANNWGGFYFQLGKTVTSVDVTITGAGGSMGGSYSGGSGGTGKVTLTPAFLTNQTQYGFWVILGQAGKPSAGGSGGTTAYRAFNGGGAATDWSNGQNTYTWAGGGGGGSDLRFVFNGATSAPHASGDPTLSFNSRFAIVGGGGGATENGSAVGGFGGGFNLVGGDGAYTAQYMGHGGTLAAGGAINGGLGLGGDGLQDGSEGWAGGGGGGYYGGGAPTAHGGGGGGSGYLLTATGLSQVSTSSGTQGGNATTTRNGALVVTAN